MLGLLPLLAADDDALQLHFADELRDRPDVALALGYKQHRPLAADVRNESFEAEVRKRGRQVLVARRRFPRPAIVGRLGKRLLQRFDLALKVLESAVGPRTTVQSPLRWNEDGDWKLDYNNLERMPPEEIAKRRAEFDKVKQVALQQRQKSGVA